MSAAEPISDILAAVLGQAHSDAQCRDYYCGCWDEGPCDIPGCQCGSHAGHRHSDRFVASLSAQGWRIVPVLTDTPSETA